MPPVGIDGFGVAALASPLPAAGPPEELCPLAGGRVACPAFSPAYSEITRKRGTLWKGSRRLP